MKHVNRKQVNVQLKKMLSKTFIYAYGVDECGKSTAIKKYLKNDKHINYQWFKLREQEKKEDIWKTIYIKIKDRCGFSERMKNYPIEEEQLREYAKCFKGGEAPFVLVFQGGGEENIHELLDLFWELSSHGKGILKIIFIHTRVPGKKMLKYVQKGRGSILNQSNFLFQASEIDIFYKNLKQEHSAKDVEICYQICAGWVAAMKCIPIKQMPNVPINGVRDLMEKILLENFSPKQIISLMKISFLKTFELDQVYYLTKDKGLTVKIVSLGESNFIFQEGEGYETFHILPLFRKLLVQKLNASRINRQELNRMHLQWLIQKGKYLESLEFAFEVNDSDMMLFILSKYPDAMYYDLRPKLMQAIYEELPMEKLLKHVFVFMQVMGDYLLAINPQKGLEMLNQIQLHIESMEAGETRNALLGELELFLGYAAYNNLYDMCAHFKKAYSYIYPNVSVISKPDMVVSFGSPHVLYQYLIKPGDCEHLISFMEREIKYYADITQGLNTAIDIQSRAEYELEKGQYANARMLAEKAYHSAFSYEIHYMCVCSMFTLGRASILAHDEQNFTKVLHLLDKEKERSRNVFLNKEIESALSYLLALQPTNVMKAKDVMDPNIEIEVIDAAHHSFSYIAQGQVFIYHDKFDKLYTLSQKMKLFYQNQHHVFGDIYTDLYESIALYYMGKEKEAAACMASALNHCIKDKITTPIVEQGSRVLDILHLLPHSKQIEKIEKEIQTFIQFKVFHFNEKELQIYLMHKKGYSRSAIADEMDMSIYAVKYYLQNIKKKTNSRRVPSLLEQHDI
ncbi:helix-turn-helix transcriptional regulator [[Eubacterium] hominis]|uniref:helix-turn-helix transcriptional regulator n=1 Tax=[Eubacterium] hominis TaxID=2764325 RepID=UPI003A4D6D0F